MGGEASEEAGVEVGGGAEAESRLEAEPEAEAAMGEDDVVGGGDDDVGDRGRAADGGEGSASPRVAMCSRTMYRARASE